MNWFIQLFSPSRSVEVEVLQRLPSDITFEFHAEFDSKNNIIIFASSAKYPGLITEGSSFDEVVRNACDAILTYFNVPREYANLIEYQVQKSQSSKEMEDSGIREVILSKHTLTHA
jgi:predicted RNase H-like HicB family nuclease